MMKKLVYISILILWSCNTLLEQSTPLQGDFYIQDGWLAFTADEYDEADKHFNTAIDTDDSDLSVHFRSYIGLGWTHIYKAHSIQETSGNGLVKSAGEKFDIAINLLSGLNEKLFDSGDKNNLYAGLAFQRSYFAKQKVANGIEWETTNATLSDTVRMLYEESTEFSYQVKSNFEFQYDLSLNYNNIILLRTENYILLGDIILAVEEFKQLDFDEFDFEITEDCSKEIVKEETIVECLCIVSYNGTCPFSIYK